MTAPFFIGASVVCFADRAACGRELNAKGTPDGFLSHFLEYIKENNLSIGRIINCTPNEGGATNFSIENGNHAATLANSIYSAIAHRSTVERRATLHIFAAAPNAFMFFLGQISRGFGKCVLYEYDFEQRDSCSYSESISFRD